MLRRTLLPVVGVSLGFALTVACGGSTSGSEDPADPGTTGADVDAGKPVTPPAKTECEDKADGTPCGDATASDCDLADTCKAGVCEKNLAASGASCGEAPTACTDQGTCDGAGKCSGNAKPAGTACGDATATDCTGADTCDGAGACAKNDKADGTACGSATSATCDQADTCVAGACTTNVAVDGAFCQDCAAGVGKCGLCATGACPNLCEAPTSTGIETSFGGGNSQRGNMFEVDATKDVLVIGADVNANVATADVVEFWSHPGALAGTTTTAGAWRLHSSATTPNATGRQAVDGQIFVPFVTGTNSVYVTRNVVSGPTLSYTDGSGVGTTVTDDGTLKIKQGYGKDYPFGDDYQPRIWNGALKYIPGTATGYAGGVTDNGEMFDVRATTTESVRAFSVNLPAGDHTVHVYFHPGTYVGTEADAAKWTQIGGDIAVKSAGDGTPAAIPVKVDVTIPAGKTYGFYVTTTGATSMNATAGTAVGTLANAAGGTLEIYEGAGIVYPFGTKTTPRKPNVTAYFGSCN